MIRSLDGFLPEPGNVESRDFEFQFKIEEFTTTLTSRRIPMKKILLVLAMLAIASLMANATNYQYSFETTAHGDYCDGININTFQFGSSTSNSYVDGYHDYVTNCGRSANQPTLGFKFSLSALNGDWFRGAGVALSDLANAGSGCAIEWADSLHPTGNTGRWEIYEDCNANGGGWFVLNYGYLAQGIATRPQHQGPVRFAIGTTE
jgi:hypothetical protein